MAKFLSWLPSIFSAIVWLIGQIQAAQSQVMQASGAFSSSDAASESIAFWSNVETGGFIATILSLGIPWIVNKFWTWKESKGGLPVLSLGAAMTSLTVLRQYLAGREADMTALDALKQSVITVEANRVDPPAVKGKSPVVALEVK